MIGDAILRQAATKMSSCPCICQAHNLSNAAKSAIERKAPEFLPEIERRYDEFLSVLRDANKVLPKNERLIGRPVTLNQYIKSYELSGKTTAITKKVLSIIITILDN